MSARLPELDTAHPGYRLLAFLAEASTRYHRTRFRGARPEGPCIYVALHGAGYFVFDLCIAGYCLCWREFLQRRGPRCCRNSRQQRQYPATHRSKTK